MAELKTKANSDSVDAFIDGLEDKQQSKDSKEIIKIMSKVSGEPPVMWGSSVIGFGNVKLKYASGRELDWLRIGFSPRKGKISLYITVDAQRYQPLLDKMGKYKTGKGCIYINRLADVDMEKLIELIDTAYNESSWT